MGGLAGLTSIFTRRLERLPSDARYVNGVTHMEQYAVARQYGTSTPQAVTLASHCLAALGSAGRMEVEGLSGVKATSESGLEPRVPAFA